MSEAAVRRLSSCYLALGEDLSAWCRNALMQYEVYRCATSSSRIP